MSQVQTPGVYIVEKNAFPNSIVEVPTAVPVFIGYTEKATYKGKSLANQAVKISSMMDYITFFGDAPLIQYTVAAAKQSPPGAVILNGSSYLLAADPKTQYYLYSSVRLYFENNGGPCYIYSTGLYGEAAGLQDFTDALTALENVHEPTLVVAPDTLLLSEDNYKTAIQEILTHCEKMQDRFAIFDVYNGAVTDPLAIGKSIQGFRNDAGMNALNYGAAYFPWANTTAVQDSEVSFLNLQTDKLKDLLETGDVIDAVLKNVDAARAAYTKAAKSKTEDDDIAAAKLIKQAHQALLAASTNYTHIMKQLVRNINILPVAGIMAGVYAYVDNTRGVWKAPANVSLIGVVSPTVNLNDDQQANLNVDATTGKSVNVIRAFTGLGVLVWGARTLDGNSQDWRYINVRRTLIMIEQSVKLAARSYVFELNDSNTWATVKSMINNFLTDIWKQGALAGNKPEDAFNVSIGLGSTMTAEDVLNGIMNISVQVAITHPAEFIIITFQQQMQKS